MNKIKIGLVGATGYTGVELLRLLANHPFAEVIVVTSRSEEGKRVDDLFPSLRGFYDLVFSSPNSALLKNCDLVFFATPNGVAMNHAGSLIRQGVKVIDLSADFRIKDVAVWEKWYQLQHASPELIEQAIYGLPEMNRELIKDAQLIANPGCYPTAVTIPLIPLLQHHYLKASFNIIADCKSSISGAGRSAKIPNLLCEAADNFKAYAVAGHRHLPEIKQSIASYNKDVAQGLVFVPHLVPMIRGMQATTYIQCIDQNLDVADLLTKFYQNSQFVDIMTDGQCPETRSVRASNICRVSVQKAPQSDIYILISVIDNLVKGAAGQAIQNMNIMFAMDEHSGLKQIPVLP